MNLVSLTSFGSTAVQSLQMKKWRHGSALQLTSCQRTGDGKIERRQPSWRSERINNWMEELDRRTDTWKVDEEKKDRWTSSPEILAANVEPLIWWHLR